MTDPFVVGEPDGVRARVRFIEFRNTDDRLLRAWARFHSAIIDAPPSERVTAIPAGSVHAGFWRLLATNNRELGRSFMLYPRFESAEAHVRQLQQHPDRLSVRQVRGPRGGARAWIVLASDVPVMTCSRWYNSLSGAVAAANGAVEAFRSALIADVPDRSDASGRFRRPMPVIADVRTR